MTRTSELTFDDFLKAIRPSNFSVVYTDENCQLPSCIHDDFQEWLIGRTQSSVGGKTYISKREYSVYYNKVIYGKGIGYRISFLDSGSKDATVGKIEPILDNDATELMLSIFLNSKNI